MDTRLPVPSAVDALFTPVRMIRWNVPRAVKGIMPVVVIPLLSVAAVGFLMFVLVGSPIASAMNGLTDWLNGLSGSNAILLGVPLGALMASDLGGPLNKVAYTFAAGALTAAGTAPDAGSLKGDGRRDGRRHDPAARHGLGDRRPAPAVHPRGA